MRLRISVYSLQSVCVSVSTLLEYFLVLVYIGPNLDSNKSKHEASSGMKARDIQ